MIIVIFLHRQDFWVNFCSTQKCMDWDKTGIASKQRISRQNNIHRKFVTWSNFVMWSNDKLLYKCNQNWSESQKKNIVWGSKNLAWGSKKIPSWFKCLGSSAEMESSLWRLLAEVHLSSWLGVAWAELESYLGKYLINSFLLSVLFPLPSLMLIPITTLLFCWGAKFKTKDSLTDLNQLWWWWWWRLWWEYLSLSSLR